MQQFVNLFWQMALLRRSPADVPDSSFLLGVIGGVYLLINLGTVILTNAAGQAVVMIFADLALLTAWALGVLASFGRRDRFAQTLSALLGTGALLQLISLPLSLAADLGMNWLTNLSVLAFLFILLWAVTVYGFIVARAIETSAGIGVFFASIYFLLSFQLAAWLLTGS